MEHEKELAAKALRSPRSQGGGTYSSADGLVLFWDYILSVVHGNRSVVVAYTLVEGSRLLFPLKSLPACAASRVSGVPGLTAVLAKRKRIQHVAPATNVRLLLMVQAPPAAPGGERTMLGWTMHTIFALTAEGKLKLNEGLFKLPVYTSELGRALPTRLPPVPRRRHMTFHIRMFTASEMELQAGLEVNPVATRDMYSLPAELQPAGKKAAADKRKRHSPRHKSPPPSHRTPRAEGTVRPPPSSVGGEPLPMVPGSPAPSHRSTATASAAARAERLLPPDSIGVRIVHATVPAEWGEQLRIWALPHVRDTHISSPADVGDEAWESSDGKRAEGSDDVVFMLDWDSANSHIFTRLPKGWDSLLLFLLVSADDGPSSPGGTLSARRRVRKTRKIRSWAVHWCAAEGEKSLLPGTYSLKVLNPPVDEEYLPARTTGSTAVDGAAFLTVEIFDPAAHSTPAASVAGSTMPPAAATAAAGAPGAAGLAATGAAPAGAAPAGAAPAGAAAAGALGALGALGGSLRKPGSPRSVHSARSLLSVHSARSARSGRSRRSRYSALESKVGDIVEEDDDDVDVLAELGEEGKDDGEGTVSDEQLGGAWLRVVHKTPTEPTVSPSTRGFRIYVDAARSLPDNTTITLVVAQALKRDGSRVGSPCRSACNLSSSSMSPTFLLDCKFECEEGESLDPTTLLYLRIDTVDRSTRQPGKLGYALLNVFVEAATGLPPVDSGTSSFVLNGGAFQLPLHAGPPKLDPLTAAGLDGVPRIPCSTVLIRICSLEEESAAPPDYASSAYDSQLCVPTQQERRLYVQRLMRDDPVVTMILDRAARRPDGSDVAELADDAARREWIEKRLALAPERAVNYSFVTPYSVSAGFRLRVDGLVGLPSRLVTKVIASLVPPGKLYGSPPSSEDTWYTRKHDWAAASSNPHFLSEEDSWLPEGIAVQSNLTILLDVRALKRRKSGIEIVPVGWAVLPVFVHIYVNAGCYQLPLYKGAVPPGVVAALGKQPAEQIAAASGAKLLEPASVIVRLSNPLLPQFEGKEFENLDKLYIPPKRRHKYRFVPRSMFETKKTLAKLVPKGSTPEAEERELNARFEELCHLRGGAADDGDSGAAAGGSG
eukprot:PLAT5011.7.p1 GENE.PLAT5011.7~~PLAT5011.7.p1  ORF type:complete len:1252 (+),score=466.90 PLAT5011.7:421-3756(+)